MTRYGDASVCRGDHNRSVGKRITTMWFSPRPPPAQTREEGG